MHQIHLEEVGYKAFQFGDVAHRDDLVEGTLTRFHDMQQDAILAQLSGRQSIEVPFEWIEDFTSSAGRALGFHELERLEIQKWNDHCDYLEELSGEYADIPVMLKEAAEMTGKVAETDERFESVDASLVFFATTGGRMTTNYYYDWANDEEEARLEVLAQAYKYEVDVSDETLWDFSDFCREVETVRLANGQTMTLNPEVVTKLLAPVKDLALFVSKDSQQNFAQQVYDLEEGLNSLEHVYELYIESLREAAWLLDGLGTEELVAYDIDQKTLAQWFQKVADLQTASEKRRAELPIPFLDFLEPVDL